LDTSGIRQSYSRYTLLELRVDGCRNAANAYDRQQKYDPFDGVWCKDGDDVTLLTAITQKMTCHQFHLPIQFRVSKLLGQTHIYLEENDRCIIGTCFIGQYLKHRSAQLLFRRSIGLHVRIGPTLIFTEN